MGASDQLYYTFRSPVTVSMSGVFTDFVFDYKLDESELALFRKMFKTCEVVVDVKKQVISKREYTTIHVVFV